MGSGSFFFPTWSQIAMPRLKKNDGLTDVLVRSLKERGYLLIDKKGIAALLLGTLAVAFGGAWAGVRTTAAKAAEDYIVAAKSRVEQMERDMEFVLQHAREGTLQVRELRVVSADNDRMVRIGFDGGGMPELSIRRHGDEPTLALVA